MVGVMYSVDAVDVSIVVVCGPAKIIFNDKRKKDLKYCNKLKVCKRV